MAKHRLSQAKTEAKEAAWFERNQDHLVKLFEQAAKEGTLRVGEKSIGITVGKPTGALVRPRSQKVMLRMPLDDLDRARRLAARKGVGYQTYIKMIVREGLDRAEAVKQRA